MRLFFLSLFFLSAPAFAAGGGVSYPEAPIDRGDYNSLQRGAALFVANCMGCHSAQYVRYGRLEEDLKIPRTLLRKHLMPVAVGIGDTMQSAALTEEMEVWFNSSAPDLSLIAKLRGTNWLYAYLRGFYRDEASFTGWNNTVFPNVSMPHVLWSLQGEQELLKTGELSLTEPGRLSAVKYDLLVADLVNFLDYISDPARPARHRAGYLFLSVLLLLLVFSYFLYREYWRDVN